MSILKGFVTLMILGIGVACADAGRICPTRGCGSAVFIEFPGLAYGDYLIDIVADGKRARSRCTASPAETRTEGPVVMHRGGPCSASLVGTPRKVSVTLRGRDGKSLTRHFTPVYEPHRPNGPHCEPVCQRAVIEF